MKFRNTTSAPCLLEVFDSSNQKLSFAAEPDEVIDVPEQFKRVVPTLAPQLQPEPEPEVHPEPETTLEAVDVVGEPSDDIDGAAANRKRGRR
jgi:hypothetical protein